MNAITGSGAAILDVLLGLLDRTAGVFSQKRVFLRAKRQALGAIFVLGTHTIARTLAVSGRSQKPWSSDYRLFSRSPWEVREFFESFLPCLLPFTGSGPIIATADYGHIEKTGKKNPRVHCIRDPLSPAFHCNLIYGMRYFLISILCAPQTGEQNRDQAVAPRAVPVHMEPSPVMSKPGKKATEAQKQQYKEYVKERAATNHARESIENVRKQLDANGAEERILYLSLDAGFCNRVMLEKPIDRVELICRTRKDARLSLPLQEATGKRVYSKDVFTPESIKASEAIPWEQREFFYGDNWYPIRYKEVPEVFWQNGARRRKLRLIVIAPTGYRRGDKKCYRQPAYLLTTDLTTPAHLIVDYYLGHWQIELNHRDLKTDFGLGDAQVHAELSVDRQPSFVVGVYSMILIASMQAHGFGNIDHLLPPPKWGRKKKRASFLNLLGLLRSQINANADLAKELDAEFSASEAIKLAAA
jgi:hypothetical protein